MTHNPAREALTRAVNKAIANGAPVFTNVPAPRTVHISIGEVASYEFTMEVPAAATDEQIAELAEAHFVNTPITEMQCEVHAREIESIDGEKC